VAEGGPTAIANFPCSEAAFQLDITDDSNADEYIPGDMIIVDPIETPIPGDMVFAAVDKERTPVVRKYTLQIVDGERSVVLEALNRDWGKHTENIEVIGVVMEHIKPRRRGPRRVV
jgi:SOS-response transcriptional repressor LexA